MEEKDWEHQFQRIVENLDMEDMVTDPREGISLWEINRAILGMTEASMYLSRFVGQFIQHDDMSFPDVLGPKLREIVKLADQIADELADCSCPECAPECEHCDDGGVCPDCARELLEEDEDE